MKKIVVLLALMTTVAHSQEFAKGKELFNTNCASCHNMERKMTGPALQNVVGAQGREWVTKWVLNSGKLIKTGDAHANEVFKEYNEMAMPAFQYLKADELSAIVDYLEGYSKEKAAAVVAPTSLEASPTTTSASVSNQTIPVYLWLILALVVLVVVIAIVIISKALNLLISTFDSTKIFNNHLLNKLNIDKDQASIEVEILFEKEVERRVNKKVKSLKNDLNDKLKDFK